MKIHRLVSYSYTAVERFDDALTILQPDNAVYLTYLCSIAVLCCYKPHKILIKDLTLYPSQNVTGLSLYTITAL